MEHLIEVFGMPQFQVSFNSKFCSLPFMIVRQGNVNLADRNLIHPLQLMALFKNTDHSYTINNVSTREFTARNHLRKFKDLFLSLGVVKDV